MPEFDRVHWRVRGHSKMTRFVLIVPFIVLASMTTATAQQQQPGHDACARDVARHCRKVMNDGDQVVLACLKQNRARLSKACDKVLTEHGQ
jgi:Cysteine rich repeat